MKPEKRPVIRLCVISVALHGGKSSLQEPDKGGVFPDNEEIPE
jgi:hypothetical protein